MGQIFGYIHNNRTRSPRRSDKKGLLDDRRDVFSPLNHEAVFHDGSRNTHHVSLLKGIFSDQMALHLPRENNQGNRIHIRSSNTGNGVGRAGARRHQNDSRFAGCPRVPVSGVGRRLLMTHQNMRHRIEFKKSIVDVQGSTTGIAEDVFDSLILQGADEHLAARKHFHVSLQPVRSEHPWDYDARVVIAHTCMSHEPLVGSNPCYQREHRSRNPCIGDLRGSAVSSPSVQSTLNGTRKQPTQLSRREGRPADEGTHQ